MDLLQGGNEGIHKLAEVLQNRVHKLGDKAQVLDFGVVQQDMSLLTNKFPLPIPQSDYMVCRSVSWSPAIPMSMTWWAGEAPEVDGWEEENWGERAWQGGPEDLHNPPVSGPHGHGRKGEHDHFACPTGKHYHDVYLPDKMRWIQPGDRVLVAWVGDDACVVDLVFPATVIK